MKKKKSYKRRIVSAGIAMFFFIALFVFLVVWFFGARYPRFSSLTREEGAVPAWREGISPQGLTAIDESTGYSFAVSGYMTDGTASRLYLTGEEGEKYVTLAKGGEPLTSHFGGVACTGDYLVVCNDSTLARVRLSDVLAAENGAAVEVFDELPTGLQNAFVSCFANQNGDKYLFAGEFYRAGNYETDESHHIEKNGETNYAFVYAYAVEESYEFGVASVFPEYAFSVRGLVQGIAVTQEHVYLSTSYGLPDSELYIYTNPVVYGPASEQNIEVGAPEIGFTEVPLFRLDSTLLKDQITMPCMSEEICIKDGRLYILFESLCKKYRYFVRTRMDRIISMELI